jgi:glycosyltransferase involved in cell wall biosynthesis
MVWLRGPIGRVLGYLRDRSLEAARANVVVGRRMAQRLVARGIRNETIRLIPNFAADDQIRPVAHADNPLRKEWGLDDKFVVGYSGNLGRVHEFATILDVASRLKSEPRTVFLCIGGGAAFERLADAVGELGLRDKFIFRPYQPREALRYSLATADVHWVSLRPEFEGLVVPSKLYGIAAAQRPIIAIAAKDGELGDLVRSHQCGVVIEPGDGAALAANLIEMMNSPSLCAELGSRARKMLENDLSKEEAVRRWRELLIEVRKSAGAATMRLSFDSPQPRGPPA